MSRGGLILARRLQSRLDTERRFLAQVVVQGALLPLLAQRLLVCARPAHIWRSARAMRAHRLRRPRGWLGRAFGRAAGRRLHEHRSAPMVP